MTKEDIYDEQIAPLMDQIITICKEHGIGMLTSYALDDDMRCTSNLPDETGHFPFARQCAEIRGGTSPVMVSTRDADGNVTSMTAILD